MNVADTLSDFLKWSNLRAIWKSPVVALTILVPFIGSAILLNDTILSLLDDSRFAQRLGGTPFSIHTIGKLYFTYFGLLSTGVGAILFSLLCPPTVKNYATAVDFVSFEQQHFHSVNARQLGKELSEKLLPLRDFSTGTARQRLQYRARIGVTSAAFADDVFKWMLVEDRTQLNRTHARNMIVTPAEEQETNDFEHIKNDDFDDEYLGDVYLLMISQLPEYNDATAARIVSSIFGQKGNLLKIKYALQDRERFLARLHVALFFASGFLLLSIPTLSTIFSVAWTLSR